MVFTDHLPGARYFSPDPSQRKVARELYAQISSLPLICPHTHVDPRLFADEAASFGTPADLFIIPDHYVFRMLYSHGVPLEALGIARVDGAPVEKDPRKIWQVFADHFYLFRATPTGTWLAHELTTVFGVTEKLTGENAQRVYDQVAACLEKPEFRPRALFEQFNIEVLCTTEAASDRLVHHGALSTSGWKGDIRPTFRPDAAVTLNSPNWQESLHELEEAIAAEISSYPDFIRALETQRTHFKALGATASDHAALTAYSAELSLGEADRIFQSALRGKADEQSAARFSGHMLVEMARMSVEDSLVMQLHSGACRDHNDLVVRQFGADKGADIPIAAEYTRNLRPLLNRYGNHPNFTLILFTLDESVYSRELSPLAGHYPAVKLGPPWWFLDSPNGMRRYLDLVVETAGIYNLVGFNDDTRAFPSIPARHDLWRRVVADWLAGLLVRHVIDEGDAYDMAYELAYGLARRAYHL